MPRSKKDPPLKVLLFSENKIQGPVIKGYLRFFGHQVELLCQLEQAKVRIQAEPWDLAIWDHAGHPQGFTLITDQQLPPPLHVGILPPTVVPDAAHLAAWGYQGVLASPVELEQLEAKLKGWMHILSENFGLCLDSHGGDVLDLELIRSRFELDAELLPQLGEIYFRETPKTVAQLASEVAQGNPEGIEAWSHRLKGMAGNLGAKRISNLAAEMERKTRALDLTPLADLLNKLQAAVLETDNQYRELLLNPRQWLH